MQGLMEKPCGHGKGACEYKNNKLGYIVNYYNSNPITPYSFYLSGARMLW